MLMMLLACTGKFDHLDDEGTGEVYRLQLRASCIDDLCADHSTYGHVQTVLGGEGECEERYSEILETNVVDCDWPDHGVSAAFDDANGSGVLGETEVAIYLSVWPPYDGSNAQGLTLDHTLDDFIDVFGEPDYDYDWHHYF